MDLGSMVIFYWDNLVLHFIIKKFLLR